MSLGPRCNNYMSAVLTNQTADRMTREREFRPVSLRQDKKDLLAQISIAIEQMLDEKINGNIIVNVTGGAVTDVKVREIQRIKS